MCAACPVFVNAQPEKSSGFNVSSAVGQQIITIEGLSNDLGHPDQKAMILHRVPHCGYFQSGMLTATVGALNTGQHGN